MLRLLSSDFFHRGEVPEHPFFKELRERPEMPSSPEVRALLDDYILREREREKGTLIYRIKKALWLVREVDIVFNGRKGRDLEAEMHRFFAEQDKVFALVKEFKQWEKEHPEASGKSEVNAWKEFLSTRK